VPAAVDARGDLSSRFYTSGLPPTPTPTAMFSVLAAVPSQPGPPIIPAQPPTSEVVPLFFTDTNFNYPNSKYVYAVNKPAAAKLTLAFTTGGAPTTIDGLGMVFSQLYCNSQTPVDRSADCSSQCNWAPCYPVVDLSQFAYGSWGSVNITGGATPEGAVCVGVTGSLTIGSTTVNTPINICGTDN
jgi:hypothetical protein